MWPHHFLQKVFPPQNFPDFNSDYLFKHQILNFKRKIGSPNFYPGISPNLCATKKFFKALLQSFSNPVGIKPTHPLNTSGTTKPSRPTKEILKAL